MRTLPTFLHRVAGWSMLALLFSLFGDSPSSAQPDEPPLPNEVQERLEPKTSVDDALLRRLENDFLALLKTSPDAESLLEAERLLAATNDNTHWTNYAQASQLLRRTRDKAAIPLLLRYMVEHSRRSASHVMIPEYAKTISLISGHPLDNPYKAGADLEQRMRHEVGTIVDEWWSKEMHQLTVQPDKLSTSQLQVMVAALLQEIRKNGDFTGAGGQPDSAYGAYHNVYYNVVGSSSSDRMEFPELHPAMVTMILQPSGYRAGEGPVSDPPRHFPYETIPLLGELAKTEARDEIDRIARDANQNSTVRLACMLSLFRAGESLHSADLREMLLEETKLENRLIMLLALRWAGAEAIPVLLDHMDHPNIEIATAAACALQDAQPDEALPKFKALLNRNHHQAPILLLSTLAEYQTSTSREILAELLQEALKGEVHRPHLSRILSAFVEACDLPRPAYAADEDKTREQAQLALAQYRQMVKDREVQLSNLTALVESTAAQLKVAEEIQALRQREYKRLLALQGDGIVTTEQSQTAAAQLEASEAEVKTLRSQLDESRAQLEALKR